MGGQLDEAELTLAKIVFKVVVVEQIGVPDNLAKAKQPVLLLILTFEIQNSRFIRRQDNFDGKELATFGLTLLGRHLLDEGTDQGVHDSMLMVGLLTITVELIASHDSPMLLVAISFGFQEALPFKGFLFMSLVVPESLQRLDFLLLRVLDRRHGLLSGLPDKAFGGRLVESLRISVHRKGAS